MPITPTYPGVYIEEIPSGVRTITGVATSITAFIGRALRGPVDEPVRIQSFADFERTFGGLWIHSTMSYAVQHYFLNGGMDAIIVRIHNGASKATLSLPTESEASTEGETPAEGETFLTLEASNEGAWGNNLQATVDHITVDYKTEEPSKNLFNLTIEEIHGDEVKASETFHNLSIVPEDSRFVAKVLAQESALVRVLGKVPESRPDAVITPPKREEVDGSDGNLLTLEQYEGSIADKTGIYALEKTDLFNLLCIPPFRHEGDEADVAQSTWTKALAYCKKRRAMLIVDPISTWNNPSDVEAGVDSLRNGNPENAMIYFPRLRMPDPLRENRLEEYTPCGAVAGIFARTDAQRGIWKAPAGLEATLTGVRELSYKLTDGENGQLNPIGVNCLRTLPVVGNVIWGSRTLEGADRLASEWKYIPVRRLALYIEESLYRGTQWVVFEPNDESLWAQVRLNIGTFMQTLFRQGAFAGKTPREAYFVKCDKETTTQDDINRGIVNIVVGFAPLKPAEFVIIKLQQMAGQGIE